MRGFLREQEGDQYLVGDSVACFGVVLWIFD